MRNGSWTGVSKSIADLIFAWHDTCWIRHSFSWFTCSASFGAQEPIINLIQAPVWWGNCEEEWRYPAWRHSEFRKRILKGEIPTDIHTTSKALWVPIQRLGIRESVKCGIILCTILQDYITMYSKWLMSPGTSIYIGYVLHMIHYLISANWVVLIMWFWHQIFEQHPLPGMPPSELILASRPYRQRDENIVSWYLWCKSHSKSRLSREQRTNKPDRCMAYSIR